MNAGKAESMISQGPGHRPSNEFGFPLPYGMNEKQNSIVQKPPKKFTVADKKHSSFGSSNQTASPINQTEKPAHQDAYDQHPDQHQAMYFHPHDERMNMHHPEGNEINQYVSNTSSSNHVSNQGREMIDHGNDEMKSMSYQQTMEPQAMLTTHIQLAMNEPDRYLPIANIGRIMKNTLDPPREKKQQSKKKNIKASIDRHFDNPQDEEQKDHSGAMGMRDDSSDNMDDNIYNRGTCKIAKEAKETMQECVTEFLLFITSEAAEIC